MLFLAMRTTLAIADDLLEAAKSLARSENRTLGEVITELARRGLAPQAKFGVRSGFPVFEIRPDASPITPEMVREAEDECL